MIIICNKCKTRHSLGKEDIHAREHSIYTCEKCGQHIKVAICPSCNSYYSISFTSVEKDQYTLKCKRCHRPFEVLFPLHMQQKLKTNSFVSIPGKENSYSSTKEEEAKQEWSSVASNRKNENKSYVKRDINHPPSAPGKYTRINLGDIFAVCGKAFSGKKILVAGFGVIITFILLGVVSFIDSIIFSNFQVQSGAFLKSLSNLLPLALICFMFIVTAAAISKMVMCELEAGSEATVSGGIGFMLSNVAPVLVSNMVLLLVFNSMFVLFGTIPVVGPLLFALMFLPIYIISAIIILFVPIALWFYPPIVASGSKGVRNNVKDILKFIKKHNFSLIYIVPLLFILTTIFFTVVYFIHYGSISLVVGISKSVVSDDTLKIFSAIPSQFLKVSEIALSGKGIFKSLVGGLFISHKIGGIILGIILSLISTFLFSIFVSITATISTHIYTVIEKNEKADDRSALVPLAVLALFLFIIYMFKRVFL